MSWGKKLNGIKNIVPNALIDNEISHGEFTTILNEEENCSNLKGSTRMMKSQRSDIDRKKQTDRRRQKYGY